MEWLRDDIGRETVSTMMAFGGRADQREEWSRVRFLEFIVPEGQVLYLPPYWWYSVQFPGATVFAYSFTYWSAMNWLANGDIWARYVWAVHSASSSLKELEKRGQRKILSIQEDLLEVEGVDNVGSGGGVIEKPIRIDCEISVAADQESSTEKELDRLLETPMEPVDDDSVE
jgi:hypothetical protein